MLYNQTDKKVSQDTLAQLVGKIIIAVRDDYKFRFSARLIELRGSEGPDQECWFENKSGQKWMVRRSYLSAISELAPRRA